MDHPADPTAAELPAGFTDSDDFEFMKLMNVGANPVLPRCTASAFRWK